MSDELKCPKCGSTDIGGLMEAFWVPIDNQGQPKLDWQDMSAETEVGPDRMCYACNWTTKAAHPADGDELVDEGWLRSANLGFAPSFPDENGHALEFGATVYGWEDSEPPPIPNLHTQVLVSFVDGLHVYLDEFNDSGASTGVVELPQIKTRHQLRSLLAALGGGGRDD